MDNIFGSFFKKIRQEKGYSIKKLAHKLEINYSYISKLENGHSLPSEEFINRIADIFNLNREELMIRAGKIPDDVIEIFRNNPKKAIDFLRREFSG